MDSASDNVTDSEVCESESEYVTESEFETSDSETDTSTGVEDCEKPQSNAELLEKKKAVENTKQKVQDGLLLAAQGFADLEECLVDSDLIEALRKSLEVPKMMEDTREEIRSRKRKEPEPESDEPQAMKNEHNEQQQCDQDLMTPKSSTLSIFSPRKSPHPKPGRKPSKRPHPKPSRKPSKCPRPKLSRKPSKHPRPKPSRKPSKHPHPKPSRKLKDLR